MTKSWVKFYSTGTPETINYPSIPVFQLLDDSAKKYPQQTAIIFFNKKITYEELAHLVNNFATHLINLGIKKGDRVALLLPNCPQAVICFYAILKVGGIAVQTSPLYVENELEHQFNDAGAETLIALDLLYPRVKNIRPKTKLKNIIITRINDFLPFPLNFIYPLKTRHEGNWIKFDSTDQVIFLKDLIAETPHTTPLPEISSSDTALFQYTGGTTGISKGVVLTHHNLVVNALQCRSWFTKAEEGKECFLCVIPFFHIFGLTVGMNFPIFLGATIIIHPKFELMAVLKLIQKYKPTMFPGVPAMYIAINNHPHIKEYDISSIKFCISGAAPLPHDVIEKFEQLTGGKLVEGFGLTESSPVTHCNPLYNQRKIGSIGIPVSDTECKIVDLEKHDQEMPLGQPGELIIKGPQVMQGYWNKPEDTALTLRNGWLYTGDIAKMDEDGYFFIVDRKKDMLISGGFNIYPRELEEILYHHPKVLEAAVIGLKDNYLGEVPKAFIVLKPGETANVFEFKEYCQKNMAKYKVPHEIEICKELPKNLLGKVLKRILREDKKKE